MSETISNAMNLKLNNETKSLTTTMKSASLVKEERRRTGRYIAILVGIMLFILALYHAWVRRIPVVASLVVPALIMFLYVAWVLYTASRDKHRLLDMEAALAARNEAEHEFNTPDCQNLEISVISKDTTSLNTPEERRWTGIPAAFLKGGHKDHNGFIMPIILINDEPPEDLDQKWLNIVDKQTNSDKLKGFHSRRKFKRKFCRKRRFAAFKRSYSIG